MVGLELSIIADGIQPAVLLCSLGSKAARVVSDTVRWFGVNKDVYTH